MTSKEKLNPLTKRIVELYKEKYDFRPDVCPKKITFDMLVEELRPETKYKESKENMLALWKCYYISCLSPNPYGFYLEKEDTNKMNGQIPWYSE